LKRLPLNKVLGAMSQDKKFEGGARFVLPLRLGQSRVQALPSLEAPAFILKSRFD
jgi:hypothetical protein